MAKQKYTKDTTRIIDGYTGAGEHQVGRVNRQTSRKANGSRSSFSHSVGSDYHLSLEVSQRNIRDTMKKGSGNASQYKSDVAFERKRKKNSKKKGK